MVKNSLCFSDTDVADVLSVSKSTLKAWEKNGKLIPLKRDKDKNIYELKQLIKFPEFEAIKMNTWEKEIAVKPFKEYKTIELFAGAGGLALGAEKAGLNCILHNEIDQYACKTLIRNRPNWNVIHDDISKLDFSGYNSIIDVILGGFPCQAFSYAGNKLGFEDIRGTLFFQFARALREVRPKMFLAENVRGLISHEGGKTLDVIKNTIRGLGYTLIEPRVLKAVLYKVPQKRERLFLIGIRNDIGNADRFNWPSPYGKILTVKDALYTGELYENDVPESRGQQYPEYKKAIMEQVPQGGYWKDLPTDLQEEYMKKSLYLSGGKTGMARRLSFDEPSLTLTCAPAQKQTERCHPLETRPLTVREYARIQTFPDEWLFEGSLSSQYKQIGNAVPVNLAHAVCCRVVDFLNNLKQ